MHTAISEQHTANTGSIPIVVRLQPVIDLSDEKFLELCRVNRDLRIERNVQGNLVIMSPTTSATGDYDSEINFQLRAWAKRDGTGKAFGSSAGFKLPNGAIRSPDASWIRLSRWNALSLEEQQSFAPLYPDFVVELRSPSDILRDVEQKMQEYMANGAAMGLLVDPLQKRVHLYRPEREAEILDDPPTVSCEPLLAGFALDVRQIW